LIHFAFNGSGAIAIDRALALAVEPTVDGSATNRAKAS